MNATERAALLQGLEYHDEMTASIDERTFEILERRRRTAIVRRRGWLVRRLLLLADVAGLVTALLLAEWIAARVGNGGALAARVEILVFLASLPGWVVVAKIYGLYDHDEARTDHSTADDFAGVFHMVTVCTWSFWVGAYLTGLAHPTAPKLVLFWIAAISLVCVGRAMARTLARRCVAYVQNTVIVGAGEVGQLIAKKLLQHPEYGINLIGFVDAQPKERRGELRHVPLLGDPERLTAVVRLFDVERVVVAFSNDSHEAMLELLRSLKDLDVQIDIVPRLYELIGPGVGVHTIEGLPLVGLPPLRLSRSSRLIKRCIDLAVAIPVLLIVIPFFALIAVLIKLESPGPVFFRQIRMGAKDRTFKIIKFRSMTVDADARKAEIAHLNKHLHDDGDPRMFKVANDPRITRVGRWLRRLSFDELPQLLNVALGDMSLVGPRPLILDEDQYVETWARRRLDLKPGITGLWQVMGRSDIPFNEMVRLDYLYVTTWSIQKDVRLILRTFPILFHSRRAL